jgi:hypothetical protein
MKKFFRQLSVFMAAVLLFSSISFAMEKKATKATSIQEAIEMLDFAASECREMGNNSEFARELLRYITALRKELQDYSSKHQEEGDSQGALAIFNSRMDKINKELRAFRASQQAAARQQPATAAHVQAQPRAERRQAASPTLPKESSKEQKKEPNNPTQAEAIQRHGQINERFNQAREQAFGLPESLRESFMDNISESQKAFNVHYGEMLEDPSRTNGILGSGEKSIKGIETSLNELQSEARRQVVGAAESRSAAALVQAPPREDQKQAVVPQSSAKEVSPNLGLDYFCKDLALLQKALLSSASVLQNRYTPMLVQLISALNTPVDDYRVMVLESEIATLKGLLLPPSAAEIRSKEVKLRALLKSRLAPEGRKDAEPLIKAMSLSMADRPLLLKNMFRLDAIQLHSREQQCKERLRVLEADLIDCRSNDMNSIFKMTPVANLSEWLRQDPKDYLQAVYFACQGIWKIAHEHSMKPYMQNLDMPYLDTECKASLGIIKLMGQLVQKENRKYLELQTEWSKIKREKMVLMGEATEESQEIKELCKQIEALQAKLESDFPRRFGGYAQAVNNCINVPLEHFFQVLRARNLSRRDNKKTFQIYQDMINLYNIYVNDMCKLAQKSREKLKKAQQDKAARLAVVEECLGIHNLRNAGGIALVFVLFFEDEYMQPSLYSLVSQCAAMSADLDFWFYILVNPKFTSDIQAKYGMLLKRINELHSRLMEIFVKTEAKDSLSEAAIRTYIQELEKIEEEISKWKQNACLAMPVHEAVLKKSSPESMFVLDALDAISKCITHKQDDSLVANVTECLVRCLQLWHVDAHSRDMLDSLIVTLRSLDRSQREAMSSRGIGTVQESLEKRRDQANILVVREVNIRMEAIAEKCGVHSVYRDFAALALYTNLKPENMNDMERLLVRAAIYKVQFDAHKNGKDISEDVAKDMLKSEVNVPGAAHAAAVVSDRPRSPGQASSAVVGRAMPSREDEKHH